MSEAEQRIREFVTFCAATDRGELARALDLPAPTVVSAVRRLVAAGELVETDTVRARAGAGRPARELRAAGPATLVGLVRWDDAVLRINCVDVTGQVVAETELAVPDPRAGTGGLQHAVQRAAGLAARHRGAVLRVVVLSVPAPFLSGRGAPREPAVSGGDSRPFPVTAPGDLESALTERCGVPVIMENDANLAALGELYAGEAVGATNAVYVMLTEHGFGSAVVVNGALARGAQGYAGELAHVQVDEDGPLCACGGRGCLLYRVRERVVSSAQAAYDAPITFADLPRLAEAGDVGAARMMRDIGRTLGGPLAHLCTFLDPELLLVGGSLGPSVAHVITGISDVLAVQASPVVAANLAVRASGLGPRAPLHGAVEIARLRARRP
jgi:predicted NBD/HSP70 family sugar kinase